jgi:hypothetical protein
MGISAFVLEDGVVHHTYSAYSRGLDGLWGMYQWLGPRTQGGVTSPASGGAASTSTTGPGGNAWLSLTQPGGGRDLASPEKQASATLLIIRLSSHRILPNSAYTGDSNESL